MPVSVVIQTPQELILSALSLIQKTEKINNMYFDLNVCLDWSMSEEAGAFYPFEEDNNIYVNPAQCKSMQEASEELTTPFWPGYLRDHTAFGVVMHEFAHFITHKVIDEARVQYLLQYPTDRLYINEYCNNDIEDEIAEILTLYFTNPYLLKLIDQGRWSFFKKFIKSPIPTSTLQCYKSYNSFPIGAKEELKNKFGIVFSQSEMDFIKIKTHKAA